MVKRKAGYSGSYEAEAPARKYAKVRGAMVTKEPAKKRRYYKKTNKTPFGDVGGIVGKKLGSAFGIDLEGPGRWLGSGIGRALFGSGNYLGNLEAIQTNSIVNQETPMVVSGLAKHEGDSVIVRKTEYIKDIVSSATANTFQIETFPLNPGQASLFPFLSNIAQNYEEYKIRGMVVHFKSLSGDSVASVQSGLGFVAMATQYDALDATFKTKSAIENYSMSQSGKPSIDQIHGIECDAHVNALSHLYVRTGSQPANSDLRLYDLGKLSIATACPGTSVTLGELWVSYDVELFKPKLSNGDADAGAICQISRNAAVATVNADYLLIGLQIVGSISAVASQTSISFPDLVPGSNYMVTFGWAATTNFTVAPVLTAVKGTKLNFGTNPNGTLFGRNSMQGSTGGSTYVIVWEMQPDANGAIQVDVTAGTLAAASVIGFDCIISRVEDVVP